MSIHEPYSHVGNTLHVGGMELSIILVAGPVLIDGGVSHSHVVCQKNDDIGIGGMGCSAGEKEEEAYSECGEQELRHEQKRLDGGNGTCKSGGKGSYGSSTGCALSQ